MEPQRKEAIPTKLHKENLDMFQKNIPYVIECDDGTIDYCLGNNYRDAGRVIQVLIQIRKKKNEK